MLSKAHMFYTHPFKDILELAGIIWAKFSIDVLFDREFFEVVSIYQFKFATRNQRNNLIKPFLFPILR